MTLLVIAGFMLFLTFFGKTFGQSLTGIGEGVSALLSPQIKPTFAPTIGLEFTPGIWEWWQGAQKWLPQLGPGPGELPLGPSGIIPQYGSLSDLLAALLLQQMPAPASTDDNQAGGDNTAGGYRILPGGGLFIR